jgi:hypothetical protein
MKILKNLCLFPGIAIMFCSCAKPLISNLQKGTYNYEKTTDDVLTVSVSVLPIPKVAEEPEKPKSFFDLRDSLPHIYLKLLSSKIVHPDTLVNYLYKPLTVVPKKAPESKPTDFTLYKVRFSFSNLKKYYNDAKYMHPNTRLEYLTTSLNIPAGNGISFYNIDRLENEYDEIDLGSLSRDQTVTLNAKISGEYGLGSSVSNSSSDKNTSTADNKNLNKLNVYDEKGNVIGALETGAGSAKNRESVTNNTNSSQANLKGNGEIGYLNSESIKEAVAVKLKRLRTGFNFSPTRLTIAQRGRPLGDITDNIYVTTTLKISNPSNVFTLNVYDFEKLFGDTNEPLNANDLKFSSRLINYVPCDKASNIKLSVDYEGAIRAVANDSKNNGVNALEYDDKVNFYSFDKKGSGDLEFDKNLYCKEAYKIEAKDAAGDILVLKVAAPHPQELDVFMDDHPELLELWVLEQLSDPSPAKLSTVKYKMYFENIRTRDKIYLVKPAMTNADIDALKRVLNVRAVKRLP